MRRLLLTASVALACATLAQPIHAQFQFGAQAAALTGLQQVTVVGTSTTVSDIDATYGLGGRVVFSPPIPVLSLSLVGQGVYYFPDNGDYMSYGIGAKFGLGLPVVTPYVIGGWQWRKNDVTTENGITAGVGVELGIGLPIFVEATFEIGDDIPAIGTIEPDNTALVIQAGVLFGG